MKDLQESAAAETAKPEARKKEAEVVGTPGPLTATTTAAAEPVVSASASSSSEPKPSTPTPIPQANGQRPAAKLVEELAEQLRDKDERLKTMEERLSRLETPRKPPIFKSGILKGRNRSS